MYTRPAVKWLNLFSDRSTELKSPISSSSPKSLDEFMVVESEKGDTPPLEDTGEVGVAGFIPGFKFICENRCTTNKYVMNI